MNKPTTPILERTIICPKCEKKTMRKAIGVRVIWPDMGGREYFCDQCHLYFGIRELVNQWNYDLGDFGDFMELPVDDFVSISSALSNKEETFREKKLAEYFANKENPYQMFAGIDEWEDNSVDTGLY
jgi:hypothetical protein